jgi:hypothetical protein
MIFAVIDGLGHGQAAAAAADIAIAILERHADQPLIEIIRHCHRALRETRGVAMSLAAFNVEDAMLTWIGVGNVEGTLLHRDPGLAPDKLLLRNGVVGSHLPTLRTEALAVQPGDILTMVTDGVTAEHVLGVPMDGRIESMADGILARARMTPWSWFRAIEAPSRERCRDRVSGIAARLPGWRGRIRTAGSVWNRPPCVGGRDGLGCHRGYSPWMPADADEARARG